MENKVLIKLIVPEIDVCYDVFIPVNEVIWKIKKLFIKSISDIVGVSIDINSEYSLINKNNSKVYGNNDVVINTDIRNGTELLFVSVGE